MRVHNHEPAISHDVTRLVLKKCIRITSSGIVSHFIAQYHTQLIPVNCYEMKQSSLDSIKSGKWKQFDRKVKYLLHKITRTKCNKEHSFMVMQIQVCAIATTCLSDSDLQQRKKG